MSQATTMATIPEAAHRISRFIEEPTMSNSTPSRTPLTDQFLFEILSEMDEYELRRRIRIRTSTSSTTTTVTSRTTATSISISSNDADADAHTDASSLSSPISPSRPNKLHKRYRSWSSAQSSQSAHSENRGNSAKENSSTNGATVGKRRSLMFFGKMMGPAAAKAATRTEEEQGINSQAHTRGLGDKMEKIRGHFRALALSGGAGEARKSTQSQPPAGRLG